MNTFASIVGVVFAVLFLFGVLAGVGALVVWLYSLYLESRIRTEYLKAARDFARAAERREGDPL